MNQTVIYRETISSKTVLASAFLPYDLAKIIHNGFIDGETFNENISGAHRIRSTRITMACWNVSMALSLSLSSLYLKTN